MSVKVVYLAEEVHNHNVRAVVAVDIHDIVLAAVQVVAAADSVVGLVVLAAFLKNKL